ncbi:MAG: hypothetical protein JXA91_01400 [Candidatus Thermoplasmatota archaeon]|nr:hypothetical protein [Candidatus Thermoplasmatota archaeon]
MKKIIALGIFLVCFIMLIMPSASAVHTACKDSEEKQDYIDAFPEDILAWLENLIKFLVKLFFPISIWD